MPTPLNCFCSGFSEHAAVETRDKEGFSYLTLTQLAILVFKLGLGSFLADKYVYMFEFDYSRLTVVFTSG